MATKNYKVLQDCKIMVTDQRGEEVIRNEVLALPDNIGKKFVNAGILKETKEKVCRKADMFAAKAIEVEETPEEDEVEETPEEDEVEETEEVEEVIETPKPVKRGRGRRK